MNSRRMMVICLLLMLSAQEFAAAMVCTGSFLMTNAWTGVSAPLNAKDILIGQTVTIRRIDRYQTKDLKLELGIGTKEVDAVTFTFSPTDVIEELDGEEPSRKPVTYRENYWCKFDDLEGKNLCYGIVKQWLIPKQWQSQPGQNVYAHVQVDNIAQALAQGISGNCALWLVGRYEKLSVPENLDATKNPYNGNIYPYMGK